MKKVIYALLSITIYLYSPLLGRIPEQILGKFILQNNTPYTLDGLNITVVNQLIDDLAKVSLDISIPSQKSNNVDFPILSPWQIIAAKAMEDFMGFQLPQLLAGYRGGTSGREQVKKRAMEQAESDQLRIELAAAKAGQYIPRLHIIEVEPLQCFQEGKKVECKGMFTIKQDNLIPNKYIISQE